MEFIRAYKKLKEGNQRFVNSLQVNHKVGVQINAELIRSQKPYAVVLTCSDSRVGLSQIFDTKLGDLFVIKIAGNIADTSVIASIEYAISELDVKLILVLSHQNCGAISYAKKNPESTNRSEQNFNHLLGQIRHVIVKNPTLSNKEITKENASYSAEKIAKNSSIISNKIKEGTVKIIKGYYCITSGKVQFFK